jgi:flagellar FliJ protein
VSAVKSLLLAIDMATRKRDQAGKDLMQLQSTQLFAQDQMTQLKTYATETEARWVSAAQISAPPGLLHQHYQFMDRLHQAIDLQQGVLENIDKKMDAARRLVLEAEFGLISLKQVLGKKQAEMALLQTRREQKQMDEFAAMQTRRSMDGHFSREQS